MKDILTQGLAQLGITPPEGAVDRLCRYADLLAEQNRVMNLTAITDPEAVARLHFLDSAALLPLMGDAAGRRLIDVGTGAGFPGLVLKLLCPGLELTLLDSLGKRVDWLSRVAQELELTGVICVHARAEEQALVKGWRDGFDFVTARAVADLRLLTELCLPYARVGGAFLAMKGADSGEELERAAHAVKLLGGRVEAVTDCPIPGCGVVHRVIAVRKLAPTLKGYPRRWAKMQKEPL